MIPEPFRREGPMEDTLKQGVEPNQQENRSFTIHAIFHKKIVLKMKQNFRNHQLFQKIVAWLFCSKPCSCQEGGILWFPFRTESANLPTRGGSVAFLQAKLHLSIPNASTGRTGFMGTYTPENRHGTWEWCFPRAISSSRIPCSSSMF